MTKPRSVVWTKRVALVAAMGLFLYGVDHWPWISTAFGWGLRGLVVYVSWIISSDTFRETKTPWRSAGKAALTIFGTAAVFALLAGGPSCDEDGNCDDYEGPPMSLEGRITLFFAAIAVMGIPTAIAAYRNRDRFPNPDFAKRPIKNLPLSVSVVQPDETESKIQLCHECGAPNYSTEWYCERCGAELACDDGRELVPSRPERCGACQLLIQPGGSYCQHCGVNLQTAKENRAATNSAYRTRPFTPKVVSVERGDPGFSKDAAERLANIVGVPAEELDGLVNPNEK